MVMLAAVPDPSELVPELSLDDLKALPDDEVRDSLLVWAGRVAAGEARLLAFLGEFDARGQWAGFPSCTSWLSWQLAIGPKAASEKVRIARALRVLPMTRAMFERGELSYTQVRAFTRFASPDGEAELLPVVRSCSGEQIERLARGIRRAKADENPEPPEQRYGVSVEYDDDGTFVLTARLPAEQGAIVLAALDTCQEQLELAAAKEKSSAEDAPQEETREEHEPAADASAEDRSSWATPAAEAPADSSAEDNPVAAVGALPDWLADLSEPASAAPESSAEAGPTGFWLVPPIVDPDPGSESPAEDPQQAPAVSRPRVSRRQALLQVAQDWLDNQGESVRRRAKPRLTAQLDPLSGWARLHNGEMLPPEIARTLSLTQFDKGRTQREVDLRLRQLLGAVDGERCRFPGCRHTRHLKAHHVIWWIRGGPTDLANLVLLCGRHHQLIHEEHFTMTLHPDRTLTVRAADGTVLPARPDLPMASAEDIDPAGTITADTCPNPWAVDRLHLAYAVGVLIHLAA